MDTLKKIIYSSRAKACWHYNKIGFKFWWRHFLTFPILSLFILSVIVGADELPYPLGFFSILAVVFDNVRCNPKARRGYKSTFDPYQSPAYLRPDTTNTWDISIPGSVAQINNLNRSI